MIKVEKSSSGRMWCLYVTSGDGEEYPGCKLVISFPGRWISIDLPAIIKPHRFWTDTSQYAWASERGGYWDHHRREYGVTMLENHVSLKYGIQTDSWPGEASKGFFLPWREWRLVRRSVYGADGEHLKSWDRAVLSDDGYAYVKAMPKVRFSFLDYDGEAIEVDTRIEEWEWHLGTKWCKWLSWFVKPKIRRSLDLEFSKEVGKRKGSWKGGTLGHGIEMLPGEMHEAAFRRYCGQNDLTFGGRI